MLLYCVHYIAGRVPGRRAPSETHAGQDVASCVRAQCGRVGLTALLPRRTPGEWRVLHSHTLTHTPTHEKYIFLWVSWLIHCMLLDTISDVNYNCIPSIPRSEATLLSW